MLWTWVSETENDGNGVNSPEIESLKWMRKGKRVRERRNVYENFPTMGNSAERQRT